MKKLIALAVLTAAVIYFLGAKDGRERLSRMRSSAHRHGKTVDDAVHHAAATVQEKASSVVDRVADAAHDAVGRAVDLADSITEPSGS